MNFNNFDLNDNFNKSIEDEHLPSITMISDINQWKHSIVNAYMIISQSKNKDLIKINLIFSDLEFEEKTVINKLKELGIEENVKVFFVNSKDFIINSSKLEHVTSATNIRLYLTEILNDESTYYIDNDIVHEGDIINLLRVFKKNLAYARRWNDNTPWIKELKKISDEYLNGDKYFNAGAIHLPLKKMREEKFLVKIYEFYEKNSEKIRFADQDILNSCLEIVDGPSCMNVCRDSWPIFFPVFNKHVEYKGTHFVSKNKQWDEFDFGKFEWKSGDLNKLELLKMEKQRLHWKENNNKIWNENAIIKIPDEKMLILLTMFEVNYEEFNYWNQVRKKLSDFVEFGLAFDGEIPASFKNVLENEGIIYSELQQNSGKLTSVNNFVQKNKDTMPKFLKIVDPDDQIDEEQIKILSDILKYNKIDFNLITSFIKKTIDSHEEKFWDSLATYNMIILTNSIVQNKISLPKISKSSDCILGLIANSYAETKKLLVPIYIYKMNNGISNPERVMPDKRDKLLKELDQFIEFFIENEDINKNYEFNSSPGRTELLYISKILSLTKNKKDFVEEIEKYFNIFKKIFRGNENKTENSSLNDAFFNDLISIWDKNNHKNITILLTLFNPTMEQRTYWLNALTKLESEGIPFFILVDNPKLNLDILIDKFKDKMIFNDRNIGKFLTVYNFVKRGEIKTSHFKVFDPDDFLLLDNLIKVNNRIKNENAIYKMKSIRSVKGYSFDKKLFDSKQLDKINHYSLERESFGNSWTILPTKPFENDNYFEEEERIKNWLEDQFLSLVPLSQNCEVINLDLGFYFYSSTTGMTSKRKDKVDNDSKKLVEAFVIFYEYWEKMNIKEMHPILIYRNYIENLLIDANTEDKIIFEKCVNEIKEKYFWNNNYNILFQNNKTIVYTADDNFIDFAIANALSVLRQSSFKNIEIVIVNNCKNKNNLINISNFKNDRIKFIWFNEYENNLFKSKLDLITVAANMRIYLPRILNEHKKVLYLDVDTYVDGDINEIFDFSENKDFDILAAEWNRGDVWIGELSKITNINLSRYFNSGVLMMNLEELRKNNFIDRTIENYNKFESELKMIDQDLINITSNIQPLPWFFNIARERWEKNYDELIDKINLRIVHFLSVSKPWNNNEENILNIIENKYQGTLTIDEYKSQESYRNKWNHSYSMYLKVKNEK